MVIPRAAQAKPQAVAVAIVVAVAIRVSAGARDESLREDVGNTPGQRMLLRVLTGRVEVVARYPRRKVPPVSSLQPRPERFRLKPRRRITSVVLLPIFLVVVAAAVTPPLPIVVVVVAAVVVATAVVATTVIAVVIAAAVAAKVVVTALTVVVGTDANAAAVVSAVSRQPNVVPVVDGTTADVRVLTATLPWRHVVRETRPHPNGHLTGRSSQMSLHPNGQEQDRRRGAEGFQGEKG